jgi:hypothetical protein
LLGAINKKGIPRNNNVGVIFFHGTTIVIVASTLTFIEV